VEKSNAGIAVPAIRQLIAQETCSDLQTIDASTTFEALGVDSLELVHLLQSIEERYGPIPHGGSYETVGDVEKAICDHIFD
jgi:acyl carrier protein